MAVNEYMTPAEYTPGVSYVSQYIPLPFEDMMKQVEKKQKTYDEGITNIQKQIFDAEGIGEKKIFGQNYKFEDDQLVKDEVAKLNKRKEDIFKRWTETGGGNTAEINQLATDYATNPKIKAAAQRKKDIEAMEKNIATAKATQSWRLNEYESKLKELYEKGLFDPTGAIATVGEVPIAEDINISTEQQSAFGHLGKQAWYSDIHKFMGADESGAMNFRTQKDINNYAAYKAAKNNIFNPETKLGRLSNALAERKTTEEMLALNPEATLSDVRNSKEYQDLYKKNLTKEQNLLLDESAKFKESDLNINNESQRNLVADSGAIEKIKNTKPLMVSQVAFNLGESAPKTVQDYRTRISSLGTNVASLQNKINNPNATINEKEAAQQALLKEQILLHNLKTKFENVPSVKGAFDRVLLRMNKTSSPTAFGTNDRVFSQDIATINNALENSNIDYSTVNARSLPSVTLGDELATKEFTNYGNNFRDNLVFIDQNMNKVKLGTDKVDFTAVVTEPIVIDGESRTLYSYKVMTHNDDNKLVPKLGKDGEQIYYQAYPTDKNTKNHLRKIAAKTLVEHPSKTDEVQQNINNLLVSDIIDDIIEPMSFDKDRMPVWKDDLQFSTYGETFKFDKIKGSDQYDIKVRNGKNWESILPANYGLNDQNVPSLAQYIYGYVTDKEVDPTMLQNKFTSAVNFTTEKNNIQQKSPLKN